MIHDERVRALRPGLPARGRYVLYWMQASVRAEDNHALEYAARQSRELGVPLLVYFGLTTNYPEANARSFLFLLEGLRDAQAGLRARGLDLVILEREAPEGAIELSRDACLVVTDRAYLRHLREWRARLAARAEVPVIQVESDAVVPVDTVSGKQEWAARTLRPKLHRLMERYLVPVEVTPDVTRFSEVASEVDVSDPAALVERLGTDTSVPPGVERGGSVTAHARLNAFVAEHLGRYDAERNDPNSGAASRLSAYLHYGHLSPLRVALEAHAHPTSASFLEEVVVRRELSLNFCEYNPLYDRYEGLPTWARATLDKHASDPRPHLYDRAAFEASATHDDAWNAANNEMKLTGRMANYMRIYWGKKVLEWSASPQEAYATLMYLNNRYFLDGRNPNSYTNVAWVFGSHDRPWGERPVYGTVRSASEGGLRRKFDLAAYVRRWS